MCALVTLMVRSSLNWTETLMKGYALRSGSLVLVPIATAVGAVAFVAVAGSPAPAALPVAATSASKAVSTGIDGNTQTPRHCGVPGGRRAGYL